MTNQKTRFSINRYSVIIFFITLFFAFSGNNSLAQNSEDLIAKGDKFTEAMQNQKALDTYLEAEKVDPNNWQILWRISRAYTDVASQLKSEEEQEKLYEKALDYAEKSVTAAPDQSVTYLRRAIAKGKIALFKGVFSAVGLVKDVKADAEKAISLGTGGDYIQALSHYILGRTHSKVCEKSKFVRVPLGLGWGNMDTAISELQKAVKLYPNFRMFQLELAKAYIKEDEDKKAKEILTNIENIPVAHVDDDKVLAEAKELLRKI